MLYVSKGGMIKQARSSGGQDIPGRLTNVKGKDIPADEWLRSPIRETGPLVIVYGLFAAVPRSPALVEALLLQAHLNEYGCLPYRNKAL